MPVLQNHTSTSIISNSELNSIIEDIQRRNDNHIEQSTATDVIPVISEVASIPLEDCVCPICLDYFIDVVETGCHHRFCNFCLDNWLRVSFRRQCPTCRRGVGTIQPLPNLQTIMRETIQSELNNDIIQELDRVQVERRSQMDRIASDRQEPFSLVASIRARQRRDREMLNSGYWNTISRPLEGYWWDDVHNADVITPENAQNTLNDLDYPTLTRRPNRLYRRVRQVPVEFVSNTASNAIHTPVEPVSVPANSNGNTTQGRVATDMDNQIHQRNLAEEYQFHLCLINTSYIAIREGFRDFHYHNGRLQQLHDEYTSTFGRRPPPDVTLNDRNIDYEDFENLVRAELAEMLQNSPAAQAVHDIRTQDRISLRPHTGTLLPSIRRRLENSPIRSGNTSFTNANTTSAISQSRTLPHRTPLRSNNVLDMEQEIQNRNNQLDAMLDEIQRFRDNYNATVSRIIPRTGLDTLPQTNNHISTTSGGSRDYSSQSLRSSGVAVAERNVRQDTDIENDNMLAFPTTGATRRIGRRRPAILDLVRYNQIVRSPYTRGFSPRPNGTTRSSVERPTIISQTPHSNFSSTGHQIALPNSTDRGGQPCRINPRGNIENRIDRRTMPTVRRRNVITAPNGWSETESEDESRHVPTQSAVPRLVESSTASQRPLSAPEDENACRIFRSIQQTLNCNLSHSNRIFPIVSSTPSSNTRIATISIPQQENTDTSAMVGAAENADPVSTSIGDAENTLEALTNQTRNIQDSIGSNDSSVYSSPSNLGRFKEMYDKLSKQTLPKP